MSLEISRILHAGYYFKTNQTQIVFDPIFENPFSRNCFAFPEVKFDAEQIKKLKLDAVFISHYHDDHCSLESLNLLNKNIPVFIYCVYPEMIDLIKALGFNQVVPLTLNQKISIGDLEIIPRRALDADVDCLFQVKHAKLNILNVVDSWIDSETLDLLHDQGPWDLIMWPFQTMREIQVLSPSRYQAESSEIPIEWCEQLKKLKPKILIPSSCQFQHEDWSWYNWALFPISYKFFESEMKKIIPETQVLKLNPGAGNKFDLSSEPLRSSIQQLPWVTPIGDQNLDYHYQSLRKAPSTSEIARQFPPLTNTETLVVETFCKNTLLKKYRELLNFDDYFNTERIWRLKLYNHAGTPWVYTYLLKSNAIKLIDFNRLDQDSSNLTPRLIPSPRPETENLQPHWVTEIPMTKLYAGLKQGEALTSMYVRINDQVFSVETERELKDVDVLEDPLLRTLYSDDFATYQRAQLQKIISSVK